MAIDDRIELRGLRVLARCGVLSHEEARDQPIEIDVDVMCDLQAAGASDDLSDTVDYGAVCSVVEQTASGTRVALLEHLAARIGDAILGYDERIDGVTVAVRKLRPPVPQHLATSGVRIERRRSASTS